MKPEVFKSLIIRYGSDEKTLLRENPSLENLYAFSNQREGAVEWYPFAPGSSVLLIGACEGALADIWLRRGCELYVYEPDAAEFEKLMARVSQSRQEQVTQIERVGQSCQARVIQIENAGQLCQEQAPRFDCAVAVGTIDRLNDDELKAVFGSLKENGVFIAACDNRYGVRWWGGAVPGGCMYSRDELAQRIDAAAPTTHNIRWYYPMPDYMLPTAVYSDEYLPAAGELARVIPAYNDNEFSTMDLGQKYDEICRDGRFTEFANSLVAVVEKGSGNGAAQTQSHPIFAKYNRTRRDEYKTRTVIYACGDGTRYVEKSALYDAGREHITGLLRKQEILNGEGRSIDYLKPVLSDDGMTVRYDFVRGKTLAERIAERIAAGADPVAEIRSGLELIAGGGPVHNIDSIFDNYLVEECDDGSIRLCGIDYEWVTEEEQDKRFITYRILSDFYDKNYGCLGGMSKQVFLKQFGFTPDDAAAYWQPEHDFQEGIEGDVSAIYFDNYRISVKTAAELLTESRNLSAAMEEREGLRAQLRDREAEIKRMTEVKRLSDNHIANLETMIANMRAEIEDKARAIEYLTAHEAGWSRAKRSVGNKLREKYPEGSDARKKLEYKKMSVLHPGEYYKLTHTDAGRNLMEGDFKIGSVYRQYGRLDFGPPESDAAPMVSIVIPCYNQVEFTYKCLASIKEHTGDVSYEIIIADDMSTDATAELDKFVTGITIARTGENLGFLRNCNNAASMARGRYILFLNNDTTVTDGWLSSLVDLMERDASVGLTGSKLVFPDGRLQEAGGIVWSDGSAWNYGRGDAPSDHQYNYVREVDYISGAAMMIRSELWKRIGGFDERYAPAYCEDSDLAFEVRKAGYRVVYQPLSEVIHYEGISNGTDVNGTGLKRYQIENQKKLREKWADEFARQYENTGNPDPFRARERSRGKKIILFVDHYVPTYDKDAGSRTTFMYLKLLLAKGYEIKFLGANYHHDEPYSTTLEQMGIEILYGGRMEVDIWPWIDKHAKDIHLVYLNRPHIAAKYVDYIREHTSLKIVFYGHDLHFLRMQREFELTGDPEALEQSRYWKSVEFGIMHKADMNYYPSQVEIEAIEAADPTVKAKAITAYVYDRFCDATDAEEFAKREGILFVGGFAHPPNKDGLIWFVNNVWPQVRALKKAALLFVVGSNADEEVLALGDEKNGIVIKGFVTDEELTALYNSVRVVAVPLRYGAGVKGKTVEAIYYGLPVITTPVGAEGIPEADSVMEIEDDPGSFAEKLAAMYDDTERLAEMSRAATDHIRRCNSIDAAWEIIRPDFE